MPSFDFELRWATPPEWVSVALSDFDRFLKDHAACERKASAVGMSFVVRYPDRPEMVETMIQFAREELEHFHQVYKILEKRGLQLCDDEPDVYVNLLLAHVRTGREERLLDRLITSSVIEARGFERLGMVTQALTDPMLQSFYSRLTRAEGHHKTLFLEVAEHYFAHAKIQTRLDEFLDLEADAIRTLPFRAAIH